MNAHYFQHVPYEGLGSIQNWLEENSFQITKTELFNHPVFPKSDDVDFLIIMGGPMSINDEGQYPWLIEEKKFIKQFIASGKPVIGICLGAQLIASVLGSAVYSNPEKEIGWFPIFSENNQQEDYKFPNRLNVFHWHGETFDLPKGASLLASSAVCKNQVFQIGDHIIGLQCHLETTLETARDIIQNCSHELVSAPYIQSADQIFTASVSDYKAINREMSNLLKYLQQKNL